MRISTFFLSVLVAVLASIGTVWGQTASSDSTERIVTGRLVLSVDRLRPGDSFEAAFEAKIREGYHIGAHDKDALYPAKLTVEASKDIVFDRPIYPKAQRKVFEIAPNERIPVYEDVVLIRVKGRVSKDSKPRIVTITAKLESQACKADQCYPPETTIAIAKVAISKPGVKVNRINRDIFGKMPESVDKPNDAASQMAGRLENMNPIARVVLLYLGGLILAFTPCVYPMIPVTFGYFSSQADKKQKATLLAAVYVLGIALTYSILGSIAAATGGLFGAAMQSTPVLIGIAAVLVLLALSMFGLYELQAPAFIRNRASGRSGVFGALVMGLIFGIVAAPCVGPMVLGLLLLAAKTGNPVAGFFLFFPLALGIGTPLFFIALFSARMPQPGIWMVAVKKLAGFLLLGVAAYFLLPLLPEELARYLIPIIVIAAGVYFGYFEKSIKSTKLTAVLGKVFCGAMIAVAVFMLLSNGSGPSLTWEPYTPSRLNRAIREGKPVMLDFTAKWCGVCKELEKGPFSDPKVIRAAERFTRLQVDGTDRNDPQTLAAVRKYGVKGFPTIIFFDSSGSELREARVSGLVNSDELIKLMKLVK